MSTLEERLSELSPERRSRVEARTQELISQEMTRKALCKALEQTEVRIAKQGNARLSNLSSNGHREDLLLAALNEQISAMGGKLSLVVEFEGGAPVLFSGIDASEDDYDDGEWGSFRFDTLCAQWRELAQDRAGETASAAGPNTSR